MKKYIEIFFLLLLIKNIFSSNFTNNKTIFLNENNHEMTEGLYILKFLDNYVNLDKNSKIIFTKNSLHDIQTIFILIEEKDEQNNKNYFYIKEKYTYHYLKASDVYGEIDFTFLLDINKDRALWEFIPHIKENNTLIYYIKNKYTQEYLEFDYFYNDSILNAYCRLKKEINFSEKDEFKFIKLYTENKYQKPSLLLDNEPIDVVIKYIDLGDPNLNRKSINQLDKDEDNNELKYCLRSILTNIPWIRKIYILMPNEKVFFLKPKEEIQDKIIYIKDQDLVGFNSSSSSVFLFNLFRMRQFGLSENFIYMDDDYFIGKPLKKSDFFYENNGQINPFIITDSFKEMNKTYLEELHKKLYKEVGKYSQTPIDFYFRKISSLLFLYKIFGDDDVRGGYPLIEAELNHNAIPLKLNDIEEIHGYIEKYYEFSKETLQSKYRHIRSLQAQVLFMSYARNKYDRWVNKLLARFFTIDEIATLSTRFVPTLFVINTSDQKYLYNKYKLEIFKLILIFPNRTKYELIDENEELIKTMIKEKNFTNASVLFNSLQIKRKNIKKNYKKYLYILIFIGILVFLFIYFMKKKNKKYYSNVNDFYDY